MGFSQPQAFARVFSSLLSKNGFSFPMTVSQIILDAMCDMFSPPTTLCILYHWTTGVSTTSPWQLFRFTVGIEITEKFILLASNQLHPKGGGVKNVPLLNPTSKSLWGHEPGRKHQLEPQYCEQSNGKPYAIGYRRECNVTNDERNHVPRAMRDLPNHTFSDRIKILIMAWGQDEVTYHN